MSRWSRLSAIWMLVPVAAAAQLAPVTNTPLGLPRALVFPNYDNVLVGKQQALESGAYIARTSDASASFYNPAGLVQAAKAALDASSAGYAYTRLTSTLSGDSITSVKFDDLPGYIGAVTPVPWSDVRNVRLGFCITRAASWSPGPIDQSFGAKPLGFDRVTYASDAQFDSKLYRAAVAWAPAADRSFRLGLSTAIAQTTYSNVVTLSGALSAGGQPSQFMETIRGSGTDTSILFTLGAQWDVTRSVTLGAILRTPSFPLTHGSLVTSESANVAAGSSSAEYFRDDRGAFRYKLPLEAGLGAAYAFGAFEVEANVRYHDAVPQYDFYRSDVPFQVLTTSSTGPNTITTAPPPSVQYAGRRVVNAAVGGRARLGQSQGWTTKTYSVDVRDRIVTTAHLGFNTALSPVADSRNSPLRAADLYTITGGVDFQLAKFGFSLGAGYQFGTSSAQTSIVGGTTIGQAEIRLQTISLFYAVSYEF
jgi:hypothetical protein